jgi:hypothetical protein
MTNMKETFSCFNINNITQVRQTLLTLSSIFVPVEQQRTSKVANMKSKQHDDKRMKGEIEKEARHCIFIIKL